MSTRSKITLASWMIAAGGMITELVPLLEDLPYPLLSFFCYAASIFKSLNLSFFGDRLLEYYNFESGMSTNFLNTLFYFLLLAGAFLYTRVQKETRLLRFAFSVILLCNLLYFADRIFMFDRMLRFNDIALEWTLYQIKSAGLVYLSWWILQQLNRSNTSISEPVADQREWVKASRVQRFLNLFVDTAMCMLIFSLFSKVYGIDLLTKMERGSGMQVTFFVILLVTFRLIYYPFYETFFGATPGKFLTETRVMTSSGKPIILRDAFWRTVSRFVPFEALSFLGNNGWHDRWTYTQVVKEAQQGIRGSRYLLIIPVVLMLGAAGYFVYSEYVEYRRYVYSKHEHEQKVRTLEQELKNITTDHFVKVREAQSSSSRKVYLKIEDVDIDNLFASVFTMDEYAVTPVGVGEYYQQRQELLNKVWIKKSDLLHAFTRDYDGYRLHKGTGVKLLSDGVGYEIDEIFLLYSTIINGSSGGSAHGPNITLYFKNCGWNGEVIDIKNIEGNIEWTDVLPRSIDAVRSKQHDCASFSVNGTNYKHGTRYVFELTIEDLANKKQRYRVEGVNLSTKISKIGG